MAKSKVSNDTVADSAPEYSIAQLRKHALEIFGVTLSTFDGATCGIKAKTYTIAEMQEIILKWKNKEAK